MNPVMSAKNIIALIILLFLTTTLPAQEEEMIIEPLHKAEQCRFIFENPKGSVNITGYDGSVIIVKGQLREQQTDKITPEGNLRVIQPYRFNLSAEVDENEVLLRCESFNRTVDFDIMVPRRYGIKVASNDNGQLTILRIDGEIDARNPNGNIIIQNVSGPVIASTIFGEARIMFSSPPADKPSMITSYNGNIEIRIPKESDVDFAVKTARGELITDLDLRTQKREIKVVSTAIKRIYNQDEAVKARLNKGGTEFILNSYYGNISVKAK
jgi:hypothetical protein